MRTLCEGEGKKRALRLPRLQDALDFPLLSPPSAFQTLQKGSYQLQGSLFNWSRPSVLEVCPFSWEIKRVQIHQWIKALWGDVFFL